MSHWRRPRRWRASASIIVVLALVYPTPSPCADCTPSFPYKEGWLGGDIAYSVPLMAGRSLWLFGDSFIGEPGQTTRRGAHLIANTIAISICREGKFDLDYFWGNRARPFFDSGTSEYRYWPMDGFEYAGSLYLAFYEVATRAGGGPFGFEFRGVLLARINNPTDDPGRWTIEYSRLASSTVVFPGVAAIVAPPWVYLFAVLADNAHPNHPMILTRIGLGDLAHPASSIEYLAKDGAWKRGLDWSDARIVIDAGHTEMSVRYHRAIRKWIAVQQKPGLNTGAGVRTADHLEGPWSAFENSFSMPETPRESDPRTFCYAAKEHLEFARESGDMVITYACNSFDFGKLTADMSLYRPQVMRVKISP